jgi:CheY-like chemotaxis protein
VIDDDRGTREQFATALRLAGFEVKTAVDGLTALLQIEQQLPDVVVLDLDLPMVNGIAVHTELAGRDHTRDLPVVIVTGTELRSPLPASATLLKPILPDQLVVAVQRAAAARL